MSPPHIQVTWADIKAGFPGLSRDCPLALACERAVPHAYPWGHAKVLSETVDINGMVYSLPDIAQEFVQTFDDSESVRPIDFDLMPYQRKWKRG